MASADYSVGTKVTADVSNFEKGMNKAEKSLKGFSEKLANSIDRLGKKGLIGSVANVTLAMQGLTKSFNTVIKFAKDVGKAISDCTEAYKGQIIAERALDTAIQNNPFVTGESSKALKEFASEMQRVSNYGDEELIPMMANLVSLGRTESETMQIMSVAMDMSAGMGISLDSAITQLNATLNGSIGRLGQQNAELKSLSEEELKNGRAIEILGEKFKGFSSATADTSKQLQNIKGDFKEALGQFTLPSSDLWNKFWAGFYQKGIEAINKINAFMDSQIIGKKLANAITEQIARINPADIGGRVDYTRNVLRVIGDNELEALKNYLSGLRTLSAEQEIILKRIKAEEDSRYQSSINAKKEAEEKKKQAEAEAQITAEVQKQNEISSRKTDWSSKLLDQRIEMLETERDRAMQLAEEEGEETYTIWRDYNEKILELKLEKLENEKQKALAEEGLTAEDKIKIEEYYSGETKKVYDELGKYKKKKNEEEKKEEKSKFRVILEYMAQYAKKVADTISNISKKVASVAKDVISKVGSIFKGALNVFKFNPDDALNSLLAIEDAILTFFVETLPKLPQFFQSAIQSIIALLDTLINSINWDDVQKVLNSILDTIIENAPKIIDKLLDLVINLAQTLLNGLIHFVENGGWKMLLNCLLNIQKRLEQFVVDNIDEIVQTIIDMLPDLIQFLIDSIVSASKTLAKLIRPLIKLIMALIEAIFEFLLSDEVLEASLDVIVELIGAIAEELIPKLAYLIPKLIVKIIGFIIKELPKIIVAIVKGLIEGFAKTNWFEVIKDCFMGFIDAFKDLFGIHSPSTLFEEFGGYMIEGLWNGIKNFGGWLWDNIKNLFTNIIDGISDIFSSIGGKVSGAGSGIKNAFGNVKDFFSGLGEDIKNAFNGIGEKFKSVFSTASNNMKSAFNGVGDWFKSAFSTVSTNVSNAFSNFGSIAKSAWSSIKNGFGDVGDWFKTTFSKAVTNIKSAFSGLSTWFSSLTTVINNVFSNCATKMKNVMKSAGDYIKSLAEDIVDGLSSVGGNIKDAVSSAGSKIKSFFGFANGTQSAPRGLALVGEAGPELVRFRGGEQVINNRNTQKALEGMGGTTINQNVTFNNLQDTTAFAMIQQLKQYNRQMAINGII